MARTLAYAPSFRRRLLRWFRRHGRDLPWRRTRDPYRIIVAEFMLQQTQVSRVEAYYHRFLQQYPTIESLAAAPTNRVRESWDGLGYYRRASNLQRLAQEVVYRLAGVIPADPLQLRTLPGVGRYTAGAVASFAFERPAAAVDTNVARVLRRAFHPRASRKTLSRRVWHTAEHLVPRRGKTAWVFNQAIMELGALICTARVARCAECPVRTACATGRRFGQPVRAGLDTLAGPTDRKARNNLNGKRSKTADMTRPALMGRPHSREWSGWLSQHRPRKQRNQTQSSRDRGNDPLPLAQLVEVTATVARGVEPGELGGGGE
jgi:A/G-specific adenine glycosylase